MTLQNHEYADLFPLIYGNDYEELKQDISEKGLLEPIWIYENKILDGRNRYRACLETNTEVKTQIYDGNDPLGFVISINLKRRHLNESQRAMVAAKLANMPSGYRSDSPPENLPKVISQSQAAEMLNISDRSLRTAKKVEENAAPSLIEKVQQGTVSVSLAADLSELPKDEQIEIVAKGEKEILKAAKEIRSRKAKIKKQKNEDLRRNTPKPEFNGNYDVIVIDPPWDIKKIERDVRPNQVEFDYPTMTERELSELKLPFSENTHVFMWTTHKYLPIGLRLFDVWGVMYVFTMVWHKNGGFQPIGLPQYNCEFILYGKVGTPSFVDTKSFNTCFNAPRGSHSEKPEEFYELLRRVTDGYRIDIFNRRIIEGFDTWGNESVAA